MCCKSASIDRTQGHGTAHLRQRAVGRRRRPRHRLDTQPSGARSQPARAQSSSVVRAAALKPRSASASSRR